MAARSLPADCGVLHYTHSTAGVARVMQMLDEFPGLDVTLGLHRPEIRQLLSMNSLNSELFMNSGLFMHNITDDQGSTMDCVSATEIVEPVVVAAVAAHNEDSGVINPDHTARPAVQHIDMLEAPDDDSSISQTALSDVCLEVASQRARCRKLEARVEQQRVSHLHVCLLRT